MEISTTGTLVGGSKCWLPTNGEIHPENERMDTPEKGQFWKEILSEPTSNFQRIC